MVVVADGLPLFHRAHFAVDTTMVAPVKRVETPQLGSVDVDGAALGRARRRKERVCPELTGRHPLVGHVCRSGDTTIMSTTTQTTTSSSSWCLGKFGRQCGVAFLEVGESGFGCKFDRSHPEARRGLVIKQTLSPIRGPRAFLIFFLVVLPFSTFARKGRSLGKLRAHVPACDHLVDKVLSFPGSARVLLPRGESGQRERKFFAVMETVTHGNKRREADTPGSSSG